MEIQFEQVFLRTDPSKTFWHDNLPSGHLEYFQEHYINTNLYKGVRTYSDDNLLLTVTHTFVNEDAYTKFKTDPYLNSCVPLRNAHNEANGIIQIQ